MKADFDPLGQVQQGFIYKSAQHSTERARVRQKQIKKATKRHKRYEDALTKMLMEHLGQRLRG